MPSPKAYIAHGTLQASLDTNDFGSSLQRQSALRLVPVEGWAAVQEAPASALEAAAVFAGLRCHQC